MKTFCIVAVFALVLPVAANTITVGEGADYQDIASALEAAGEGDTVSIAAGTYFVPDGVEIATDRVTLMGAGAGRTILNGEGEAYAVVSVSARDVTIAGLLISAGESHGIYVNSDNWANIHHNVINGNEDRGILLGSGSPHAVIDHNTFVYNRVSAFYSYEDDPRTSFTNNIVFRNGRALCTDTGLDNMTVAHNCFWDNADDGSDSACAAAGPGNITSDPGLADPVMDHRLSDGSPCIGAAEDGTDIGAFGGAAGSDDAGEVDDEDCLDTDDDLPEPEVAPGAFAKYRVLVFGTDFEMCDGVLNDLRERGFTNPVNNVEYNETEMDAGVIIHYGSADRATLECLEDYFGDGIDNKIRETRDFEPDDNDIWIYLP